MALYHFSVRHVSRGKGQMVVASAAYIYKQVGCGIYRNSDTGVCAGAYDRQGNTLERGGACRKEQQGAACLRPLILSWRSLTWEVM